ncbi:hypothetical protein [Phenylobacterium sp.]|uniref:hypothetical protein n=1 Tax=Phenylobacterium sp. TaxID=1871053 RepID=UPI0026005B9C|nr:hypothetical protein [Phenylobacterium sp.]
MRIALIVLAPLALAGAALAQPLSPNPPKTTIQCIEGGGQLIPPVCDVPASRLDNREYICTCPNGGQRVDVSICARGQIPPPEGKALNIARSTAIKDGSLVGDKLGDRPICVAPRNLH